MLQHHVFLKFKIDATQLAQFYANDLLTIVQVPELEMERDRDLLRSRQRLMHHREEVRRHLHAALRHNGLHYKAETGHKNGDITTHYSAPELEELIEAANRVCEGKSGKTPALVVLRHRTLNAVSR